MRSLLGAPNGTLTRNCQNRLASDTVQRLFETRNFGHFEVTGITPALDSLQTIFAAVQAKNPALFAAISSAGMLCVRLRRPTSGAVSTEISNHAWGTAIDIAIDQAADTNPDDMIQRGIAELIPFFNEEGWFSGVGFRSAEDDTHFEVADETIQAWAAEGLFDPPASVETASGDFNLSQFNAAQKAMAQKIISAFAGAGYGRVQQAAAVANAADESSLDPNKHNTAGEDSVGLFQLNRAGGEGAGHSVGELTDPDRNIALVIGVLNGRIPQFRTATTVNSAVDIFVRDYERPKNPAIAIGRRPPIAKKILT